MLDFYLFSDDKNAPGYPEEAGIKIVGSIDFETFERLKAKRIIPEGFDYHSDFRWDTILVQRIRNNIKEHMLNDSDVRPLLQLLGVAKAHGSGLMAFAD